MNVCVVVIIRLERKCFCSVLLRSLYCMSRFHAWQCTCSAHLHCLLCSAAQGFYKIWKCPEILNVFSRYKNVMEINENSRKLLHFYFEYAFFLFFICSKLFNWLKLLLCIVQLVTLYNKLPLVNIRSLTTGGGWGDKVERFECLEKQKRAI